MQNLIQSTLAAMQRPQPQYGQIKIQGTQPVSLHGDTLRARSKAYTAQSLANLKRAETRQLNGRTTGNVVDTTINDYVAGIEPNNNLAGSIKNYTAKGLKYSQEKRDQPGCSDCSRAVNRVMKSATGKSVGDTTLAQRGRGVQVDTPSYGSLIHMDNAKGGRHVGIYQGDGNMWHFGVNGAQTTNVSSYLKRNPSMSIHSYRNY